MHKSKVVVAKEKKDHFNWSWLLRASSVIFSHWPFSFPLFIQFTQLTDDITREVASHWTLSKKAIFACTAKRYYTLFQPDLRMARFLYFVAVEGEDNQNKAEAMLKSYPELISKLISDQRDVIDAAGRHFLNPMSAYEYAYWSGDTRMRHMMEKYMDQKTTALVREQCARIATYGVDFTLEGNVVSQSKHFDFTPLITAYKVFNAVVANNQMVQHTGITWLAIGKELAKVPIHVAQEYCAWGRPFKPTPTFKEPDLIRTVKFYNWQKEHDDFWFTAKGPNPALGNYLSIYKGTRKRAVGGMRVSWQSLVAQRDMNDLPAVISMCTVKTGDDLKQTLEDLKPAGPTACLIQLGV